VILQVVCTVGTTRVIDHTASADRVIDREEYAVSRSFVYVVTAVDNLQTLFDPLVSSF